MKFIEITFSKVKGEIENFLRQQHAKADILYSNASPYGQILSVIEELYQLSFLYLKNTIKQFDLGDNNSLNARVIRNAAIFAGHIPGRAISASGTIKLTLKTNTDISSEVPGQSITISNRDSLKNKTNGLEYSINIGSEKMTYTLNANSQFFIPIIQGRWETKTFTGNGEENQSIQVSLRGNQKDIENFNYEITVDGQYYQTKTHLYDLLPNELACVVRTGFNGGIDVIFGNGGMGAVPRIGSIIQVTYLITDGSVGSIFRRTQNDWTFIDSALDGYGNSIDLAKIFDIQIYTDINFGADKENLQFTKNVLPIVSNNFVLGTPQQYAYQIKKLGVFSHVNAYEEYGKIYIVVTPNIKLFKNQNSNYFTIDKRAFEIDNYEKSKIDKYLKVGGNIMLTKRYEIKSPQLSSYIMNVFIITYSDAEQDSVNSEIHEKISEYFLNIYRVDRIPKVDLVNVISSIDSIHSVDIEFTSKKNEDYHRDYLISQSNKLNQYASQDDLNIERIDPDYNPDELKGIDAILGDILFEPNEIPLIRGGWRDRNDNYYSDNIDDKGLKSVNIILKTTVDVKNKLKI